MSASTDADAPLTIDPEPAEGVDEEAARILAVYYGVTLTLELINDAVEEENPPEDLTQEHIDAFSAAFRVGEDLLEHDAYGQFREEGPSALPDDARRTVYRTFAPLAPAYGIELEPPNDAVADTDATASVVETLQTQHGRRGS